MGVITTDQPEKRVKLSGTTPVNSPELLDPWQANIKVNGKKVNNRVDTGADVKVAPGRYFPPKLSADPEVKQEVIRSRED